MSNFIVCNDTGGVVVDDTLKNIGTVKTYAIGSVSASGLTTSNLQMASPSWFNGAATSVLKLTAMSGDVPLTLIKPNSGGFGAGRETFSDNAGTLYHLRDDYTVASGFLDIFNENGLLIWSALSAQNVPRVTNVLTFTYAQLVAGIEVNIGNDLFMLNNFIGVLDVNPGPTGTTSRCYGLYWKFTSGVLKLQLNAVRSASGSSSFEDFAPMEIIKQYGWKLYLYRFAG